jgi:hypothetical protein
MLAGDKDSSLLGPSVDQKESEVLWIRPPDPDDSPSFDERFDFFLQSML